ncbi:ADP-ribosylglycohydrolase family protein [Neobittarella massiliensis]|uniref:ADP-ribosylglycohydrolase family protein n=2 Tax=Oscillospiraceae TaxID=216572 RepID=A0A8J6IL15_9FIRM|nr:ADP-ribosylglycohydrolase family protein [Neobittarella massiliensis]MBC3516566.1 ADP-ribosylglycohydrolase family protein [Neobittarella massiliensis]SCJ75869.1 ADP-ribosyl-[dinitrogen reductase] glycohydrolase [uncultured Anaerotruncus sp.]
MSEHLNLYDRVLGSIYGVAVGDALGMATSFLTPEQIREQFGDWVDTFHDPEPGHIFHDGLKAGEYTDDTEQTVAIMNSFIKYHKVVPEDIVSEILAWAERVKDKYASPLGPSTERALKSIKAGGSYEDTGKRGNTNGSAMRIAPVGIVHGILGSTLQEMMPDLVLVCKPTHNTPAAIGSAAAIAWGIAKAIQGESDYRALLDEMVTACIEGEKYGEPWVGARVSTRMKWAIDTALHATDDRQTMRELYEMIGGCDLCADSIPLAVGMYALAGGDTIKTLEYCVNCGGDCDTNACMVGAIAGAVGGAGSFRPDWIKTVEEKNPTDYKDYAQKMIEVAGQWEKATF